MPIGSDKSQMPAQGMSDNDGVFGEEQGKDSRALPVRGNAARGQPDPQGVFHGEQGEEAPALHGLGRVLQQWTNPVIPPPSNQPILDLPSLPRQFTPAPVTRQSLSQVLILGVHPPLSVHQILPQHGGKEHSIAQHWCSHHIAQQFLSWVCRA